MPGTDPPSVAAATARRWHPALTWFVVYYAAWGVIDAKMLDRPEAGMLLLAVQVAVCGFLIFWWASDDALRHGQPLSRMAPLWIVLFGMFWIVPRLLRTREPAQAWRGVRRGASVALASLASYLAMFVLFAPVKPV